MTLLNDPLRKLGLTGAFLFATTTARSSNQLLGWNCGYTFFSNVCLLLHVPFAMFTDIGAVDNVWGTLRHLTRDIPR